MTDSALPLPTRALRTRGASCRSIWNGDIESSRLSRLSRNATPAQIALAWLLSRAVVSSVIIAARTNERLTENVRAVDIELSPQNLEELDRVSNPGAPYPKWMVLQLDEAEDPRPRLLEPNRPWPKDLRGTRWSSEP